MSDIRNMQLGQVVDFIITYNERQKAAEKAENRPQRREKPRKANQDDINAFFG